MSIVLPRFVLEKDSAVEVLILTAESPVPEHLATVCQCKALVLPQTIISKDAAYSGLGR